MAQTKEGAAKISAKICGLPLERWELQRSRGLKWCWKCRKWKRFNAYNKDISRNDELSAICRSCANNDRRNKYIPIPINKRKMHGPPPAPERDKNRMQAGHRINALVRIGRLPKPNNLPCQKCGHQKGEKSLRHEYHHHYGYSAGKHLFVIVLCSKCHHGEHPK